jgi:SAM-dependent methyltransferase
MKSSRYVHGTSRPEQRRLTLLNELLNPGSLKALALRRGERVLEAGSGLGHFARAMALAVGPRGRVLGIEKSARQLRAARRLPGRRIGGLEFRSGDARALPLDPGEWGRFDVAHARFLLEHLPRPLPAVQQMVRAVRPGGRIVLEDDDHDLLRLHPEPAGFRRLWHAYMRAFAAPGNDPFIGRKLPALLLAAGATPTRCTWLFFGSCAPAPDFPGFHENLSRVIAGARRPILATGLLSPAAYAEAMAALRRFARLPGASIWYPVCWAEGRRAR